MYETRYANAFREPNTHTEIFDMVVDLNKKYLTSRPSRECIYSKPSCEAIEARYKETGSEWLSEDLGFRHVAMHSHA